MRIGFGTDNHAFGPGDSVVIAGVRLPHSRGVRAHSDGDVALHALCDALLGAAGLGDIGMHFPDTDPKWKGADSRELTRHVVALLTARGYVVTNADLTILAESPRIGRHRDEMRRTVRIASESIFIRFYFLIYYGNYITLHNASDYSNIRKKSKKER